MECTGRHHTIGNVSHLSAGDWLFSDWNIIVACNLCIIPVKYILQTQFSFPFVYLISVLLAISLFIVQSTVIRKKCPCKWQVTVNYKQAWSRHGIIEYNQREQFYEADTMKNYAFDLASAKLMLYCARLVVLNGFNAQKSFAVLVISKEP